ncbi:carboxymuconolactone decarboxylase family protein [Nonomuraea sp. NBC_01738]|uniref:carboxymuconolactone decarboxylase family protein n=1 Tax=Nonomuraea sp. NBC_01738 TaxID=2976003 RepID=UPI002E10BD93|nr:carboxymuconolactone decarboxylase family protein [Nonomuraea sp. NBC_01738]
MTETRFADLWSRETLSFRERRLLLLGLLVGQGGLDEEIVIQLDAGLRSGELTAEELREIVSFLTHYAGWSRGARLNAQVEDLIERTS